MFFYVPPSIVSSNWSFNGYLLVCVLHLGFW